LIANIPMRDSSSGPPDLNQNLQCEPLLMNILKTEYSFCMKSHFQKTVSSMVRMVREEDGGKTA
jgi:hypothetical protein